MRRLFCNGLRCALLLTLIAPSLRADDRPQAGLRRLLNDHCVACHDGQHPDTKLSLTSEQVWDDAELLDRLACRIADGEMPPDPTDSWGTEQTEFVSLLSKQLSTPSVRYPRVQRKLTASEYSHILEDVFGTPVTQLRDLPFDSEEDLKKVSDHQVITGYVVRKYARVAENYLDRVLFHEPQITTTTTYTAASGKDLLGRRYTTTHGALAGGGNEPIFVVRNPVTKPVQEGEYELTFQWHCFEVPARQKLDLDKTYRWVEPLQRPSLNCFTAAGTKYLNPGEVFKGDRQVRCWIDQPIRVRLTPGPQFLSFRGPYREFRTDPVKDPRTVRIEESDLPKADKQKALRDLRNVLRKEAQNKPSMFLLITGASFRGPLNPVEPVAQQRIFGNLRRDDTFGRCVPVIGRLAELLYGRPVSDDVKEALVAVAREEYGDSGNTHLAVKVALNTILCSPRFVLHSSGTADTLDDFAIASRMSLFLWDSLPDRELLTLAEQGRLKDPQVRAAQTRRMLETTSRSDRLIESFTSQWLGLDQFDDFTPNEAYLQAARFRSLKPHLAEEPIAFMKTLLQDNSSLQNVIDSDFVVWNQALQSAYQRDGVRVQRQAADSGFERLTLLQNPGRQRGGLLTMPAIMSLTTDGEDTQPILRGVWIARRLLGREIKPPATVPAIEVNLENVSDPHLLLQKHRSDPDCYRCHAHFDHLGLAMENFNVLGQWKTKHVHPVLNGKGRFELAVGGTISSSVESPDGVLLRGVAGVKEYLTVRRRQVYQTVIRNLFRYAWGRRERFNERRLLQGLAQATEQRQLGFRDVIVELVKAPAFIRH